MLSFDELLKLVAEWAGDTPPVADPLSTPHAIRIEPAALDQVCSQLHRHPSTYFDMLSCITGIDNGPGSGTMEVVYHLYSIPFDKHLAIKVTVPRAEPEVPTVSHIWKTADWHERETFDLLGIRFIGHPDLRRILLPADWIGHPLRKDYKAQEYYHGIKYDY